MTIRTILAVTALATLGVGTAFAQDVPSLEGKTIGITAIGTDHHWDIQAYQGAIEAVEALGGEVIALDAQRNDQTQVSQIQTLISQRPDAIIQMLGNVDVLNPWLKRIRDQDIPLFTIDTTTEYAINNSTSDNYAIGTAIALKMIEDMGGQGKILVFNGFYSVPVCRIRYDMLKYVLNDFPGVTIVEPELRDVIPNTVQSAYSDVTDMLTRYSGDDSIKAVWSCWDIPQIGATQAIEAAGREGVMTYGIDGSPEVVAMVADPDSPAGAVAAQQPREIGAAAAHNVARYLAGEEVPPFTFMPAVIVTKDNAAETASQFLEGTDAAMPAQ